MDFCEIKPTLRGDLGIFAIRPVPYGFRITCEAPIMTAIREPGFVNIPDVYDQFLRMPQKEINGYLSLHAAQNKLDLILPGVNKNFPPELREYIAKAVSIFETNGFELGDSAECGVFLTASRYNHACTPNASQVWNGNIGRLTVHANKDIAVGEEITIPYMPLFAGRILRGLALNGWDFQCCCLACDPSMPNYEPSERRRQQIYRLDQDLNFFIRRYSPRPPREVGPVSKSILNDAGDLDPSSAIQALAQLLLLEGLVGHELSKWYTLKILHLC